MAPMKWFWGFLKKYCGLLILGLVMTTLISILAIVNPYISGLIVDDVIQGGNFGLLPRLIVVLLLVTLTRSVLRFSYQVVFETCSQGVLFDMRDAVFRKLLSEDFAFYNRKKTGDLMSRQTGDMEAIRHCVAYLIYCIYENVLLFAFALFMIFTVNSKLAVLMLLVLPFTALTTFRQSKAVRPTFAHIRNCFSSLNAFVQENVSGNRVVKAFAKEDFEMEKFNRENDAYMEAQLASSQVWMKYLPVFEVLSYLLNVILMLYGGYMVIQGEITLGNLVTVNGYLWMLTVPLRMAGWWVNDIHRFITSVEKIYDTYMEEPGIKTPIAPVEGRKLEGNVEFQEVSYTADGEEIVGDISFTAKKGQTIGILGSTGAGKSTVLKSIAGQLQLVGGSAYLGDEELGEMKPSELAQKMSVVLTQKVRAELKNCRDVVATGRYPYTGWFGILSKEDERIVDEVMELTHTAGIREQEFDKISDGQKQRVMLARAICQEPEIVVLDEPTSYLDIRYKLDFLSILEELREQKGLTVIMSLHELDLAKIVSDKILCLKGEYVERYGTPEEVFEPDFMERLFGLKEGGFLKNKKFSAYIRQICAQP